MELGRKCKIKDKSELFDELDEYVEKGIISQEGENNVSELDLIVSGILKKHKRRNFYSLGLLREKKF